MKLIFLLLVESFYNSMMSFSIGVLSYKVEL